MRTPAQTTPNIVIVNDLSTPTREHLQKDICDILDGLFRFNLMPVEDEPCGKLSLSCGAWEDPSDEQEWRDDYYSSIRL